MHFIETIMQYDIFLHLNKLIKIKNNEKLKIKELKKVILIKKY